jgi:capsular exopolysaccharide synthesis family protein
MSRIHEALKKAQEERSAQQAAHAPNLPDAPELAPAPYAPAALLETPEPAPSVAAERTGGSLTFETLLSRCRQRRWNIDPSAVVFAAGEDEPSNKEVFRTLRTRLYQIRAVQPLRTVLVTSAIPGEGKTFVTSNLAQSIARQRERRTLLIDADLRLSNLHNPLGAESSPGLADYLLGEADEFTVLQRGREENLFLIAGGKSIANPTELLSNGKLEHLLERMSSIFDWILIDSPPVIPVSDANILAKMCDGILIVVRAGSTPFDLAQKACEGFQDRPLLGVVLNRTNAHEGYGGYYYQRYSSDSQNTKPQTNGTRTVA